MANPDAAIPVGRRVFFSTLTLLTPCYDIPLDALFIHSGETAFGPSTVVHLRGFHEPNRSNGKNIRGHQRTRKDIGANGLVLKMSKWRLCYVAQERLHIFKDDNIS